MVITSGKYYAYTACSLAFFCFPVVYSLQDLIEKQL
nr:MAG TPA: hypothetical protein [Caudoviricetes sp.]